LGGVQGHYLYLLAGKNSFDQPNPAWGGGDSFLNFFTGDQTGRLVLTYRSGKKDIIPLIYGYNQWWQATYRHASRPFSTDEKAMEVLKEALCVANGAEGYKPETEPYFLRIALRQEELESIALEDEPSKKGYPLLQALTLVSGEEAAGAFNENGWKRVESETISEELRQWLEDHTIDSSDPWPESRRKAVERLGRVLYTYDDDVNFETVRDLPLSEREKDYSGPRVRFEGPPEAEILSRVFLQNVVETRSRVDVTGIVHESRPKAANYMAFGTWVDLGAFYGQAYTRNRSLNVLGALGFESDVNRALYFFDHWLMYFPMAWPQVQLGGKPVPGHAPVIANKPHIYFDELSKVGWPTKYEVRDFGNPENDGHGMLMLSRWRAWVKQGRSQHWIEHRWKALNEAAEYIRWCLDNPDLSLSEHGVLYNESEGGMSMASLYCDMPCYLGLLCYADMAEAAGKTDKAVSWRELAERLRTAMEAYYPTQVEPFGDVWNPAKAADWHYKQGVLAPILFAADRWGYDCRDKLPEGWAERTERTYEMTLQNMNPEWCAPAGLGYGQNYFAQSALLFDRMADAEPMVKWLARFCYAPRHPNPFRAPEGATMANDGSVWRRWGDLGNLYQMVDTVVTIHTLAGVDDLDPEQLKIIPRIPPGWTALEAENWLVVLHWNGKPHTVNISYRLENGQDEMRFELDTDIAAPDQSIRLRLGPFAEDAKGLKASVNGAPVETDLFSSGDSQWCWIALGDERTTAFDVECQLIE
jgi:hypothetical protein